MISFEELESTESSKSAAFVPRRKSNRNTPRVKFSVDLVSFALETTYMVQNMIKLKNNIAKNSKCRGVVTVMITSRFFFEIEVTQSQLL